jgi:hypothetical protein
MRLMSNIQARHDMTSHQHQQTFDRHMADGLALMRISGYDLFGQPWFAAIFE